MTGVVAIQQQFPLCDGDVQELSMSVDSAGIDASQPHMDEFSRPSLAAATVK